MRRLRHACLGVIVTVAIAVPVPALACMDDGEALLVEPQALPCVLDAIVGTAAAHREAFDKARVQAISYALHWMPTWTEGLDAQARAYVRLQAWDDAESVMKQRLEIAPDAFESHAHLASLYTHQGKLKEALAHVDRAIAIDGDAHFGRERVHRALLVHAMNKHAHGDFLGLNLSSLHRVNGSPKLYAKHGQPTALLDAVVAMVSSFGTRDMPEVYLGLGELLALGDRKKWAYAAYVRAMQLGHPRRAELGAWLSDLAREPEAGGASPMFARAVREHRAQWSALAHEEMERSFDDVVVREASVVQRCVPPLLTGDGP